MIKRQLLTALVFVAGVAVGYFADAPGKSAAARPPAAAASAPAPARITDRGSEAALRALRARVAELERQLSETSAEDLSGSAPVAEDDGLRRGPVRSLEELRESDPVRYSEVTNRIAQFRQRRRAENEARLAFLASVDTSRLGAAGRETHAALQELVAQRAELEERVHSPDLAPEERRALWGELSATHQELHRLNEAERRNLFAATARTLGFKGEAVQEITTTLRDIVEATRERGFGGGHGRRRGAPPKAGAR